MKRLIVVARPIWVRLALWGVPGRRSAWLFVWLSIALAIGCVAYGFVRREFFIGGIIFIAAIWYYPRASAG